MTTPADLALLEAQAEASVAKGETAEARAASEKSRFLAADYLEKLNGRESEIDRLWAEIDRMSAALTAAARGLRTAGRLVDTVHAEKQIFGWAAEADSAAVPRVPRAPGAIACGAPDKKGLAKGRATEMDTRKYQVECTLEIEAPASEEPTPAEMERGFLSLEQANADGDGTRITVKLLRIVRLVDGAILIERRP